MTDDLKNLEEMARLAKEVTVTAKAAYSDARRLEIAILAACVKGDPKRMTPLGVHTRTGEIHRSLAVVAHRLVALRSTAARHATKKQEETS